MARAQEASPVREGDIIADKYRVERILGMGGMGVVVAAVHMHLKQRVAIKFLLPDAAASADTVARFLREAQASALIKSEHVARVLDVASLGDGVPYMVMEFLEGSDLSQLLEQRGPLPVEEAVGYMLEACEGVAEAHAVGIVHRDIKPSNLFVVGRPGGRTSVKVLDFGISKLQALSFTASGEAALTKTSTVMGSPLYMSPEQMTSAKHVDARTDIWSLGVTLFELLCGKTPFRGDTVTELVAAVLQGVPAAIEEMRPDLPQAFSEVLGRSLAKERDRRYADVGAFAAALAPFGSRHASMRAERIAEVLGSTPPPAATLSSPPTARSPGGIASERIGFESTAAVSGAAVSGADGEASGGVPGTTAKPVSSDQPGRGAGSPPSSSKRGAVGIVAAIAIAGVVGAMAMRTRAHAPAPAAAEPSVAASAGALSVAPPTPSAAPPAMTATSAPTTSEGTQAAAAAPAPGASTRPQTPATPHRPSGPPAPTPQAPSAPPPAAAPKTTAAAPSASTAAPGCRVVKYFDADGEVRFKKECP